MDLMQDATAGGRADEPELYPTATAMRASPRSLARSEKV